MFLRSAYNYDTDIASYEAGLQCVTKSRTEQSMRDDCDINVLVSRFIRTGVPDGPQSWPSPPDFDEIFDFQSAMNVIRAGREAFDQLPAAARRRFGNDPGEYLKFVNEPGNLHEAEKLGIVAKGTYSKYLEAHRSATAPAAPNASASSGDVGGSVDASSSS